jgi:hypothetical protein
MTRLHLFVAIIISFLFGCNEAVDKSLVGNAVKLNSPYSNFSLYRYHIESSMAFGSGFTVLKILPFNEKCDYTDRDFFIFRDNNYPFFIKWKNKDTLFVKCLLDNGSLANKQPIKTDIQKWKDWTFEVEYYSMYSSGTNGDYSIKSYNEDLNSVRFKSDRDLLVFKKNELILELDSSKISLSTFKIDTFKSKTGLSFNDYKLKMNENYRINDFKELQPFIVTNP